MSLYPLFEFVFAQLFDYILIILLLVVVVIIVLLAARRDNPRP